MLVLSALVFDVVLPATSIHVTPAKLSVSSITAVSDNLLTSTSFVLLEARAKSVDASWCSSAA